jgi:hypothetical protein
MKNTYFFIFGFLGIFLLSPLNLLAQSAPTGSLSADRRAELTKQLADVESQIAQQQKILEDRQKESESLAGDIAILDAKISQAKLSIKARSLTIEQLSDDIGAKQQTIGVLSDKLDKEKESLGQILRKSQELDDYSLVELMLVNKKSLANFFSDANSYVAIKDSLQTSVGVVSDTKSQTEEEKQTLEDKRAEQTELLHLQQLEKTKIEQQEKEKNNILKISKGLEKQYQLVLAQQKLTAAQIKKELFQLQGSAAISFEVAYTYAKEVGGKLGIRPAFLLGIIAEESNLGQNVGTGNWNIDMHPTRDKPIFEQICKELGLDPDQMPVSKKAWYGYGGAMGPAQFIPSTWVLYKDRITAITGNKPPNPWDPRDAFYASALLLTDNGAKNGVRSTERLAALRYLAGWKNATKPAYAFYGNEVLDLADKFQKQIDILEGR